MEVNQHNHIITTQRHCRLSLLSHTNSVFLINTINKLLLVCPYLTDRSMLLPGSVLQDPIADLRIDRAHQRRIRSKSTRQSVPSTGGSTFSHKHSNRTTTTTTHYTPPTTTHTYTLHSTTHHNTLRTTTNHHTLRATTNHYSLCSTTNHHEVLPPTDHSEPSISR